MAYRPNHKPLWKCIFCRGERYERQFNSKEHIFPESFAGDLWILPPGFVCDGCNNETLNGLDEALCQRSPMAFTKLLHVPRTKTGKRNKLTTKFYSATTIAEGHLEVMVTDPAVRSALRNNPLDLAPLFSNIEFPANDPVFARSLYKIALEFLCFDKGARFVLSEQFDHIRDFVLDGTGEAKVRRIALGSATQIHALTALITINEYQRLVSLEICGPRFSLDLVIAYDSRDPDV
jgi:hypothetical protein